MLYFFTVRPLRKSNFCVRSAQNTIKANAFLLHMVRNIAGSLMAVGSGAKPGGWMQEVLQRKDRTQAAATASPAGLYLRRAVYPSVFHLPESESLLFGE